MIARLLPKQIDNRFEGQRAALWLFGLYVALKLAMSTNSIFNAATVAADADGIPLDSFAPAAAREVLTLFALVGLGQLALALLGIVALVRYRAMVPLLLLLLLGEAICRRLIVWNFAAERTAQGAGGWYINMGLLALLAAGLALSLVPHRGGSAGE